MISTFSRPSSRNSRPAETRPRGRCCARSRPRVETDGDCFLLSFVYAAEKKRHILIDFGTTKAPAGNPNLIKEDAKVPTKTKGAHGLRKQLTHMHAVAEGALGFSQTARAGVSEALRGRLAFLGEDNIKNVEAVKNLLTMGKESRYLYSCRASAMVTATRLVRMLPTDAH